MGRRAWLSHSITLAHKVDMLTVLVYTSNMLILTRFSWFREEMLREGPRIWCLRLEACKGDNSSHDRRWVLGRPRSLDASKLPAVSAEAHQFKYPISSGLNCACCLSMCTVVSPSRPFWADWTSIKKLATMTDVQWWSLGAFVWREWPNDWQEQREYACGAT